MMKRLILGCLFLMTASLACGQSNNPVSMYEGSIIHSVGFDFLNPPADTALLNAYRKVIEEQFPVAVQTQFGTIMASYYTSKLSLLPFVSGAKLDIRPTAENQVDLRVEIRLADTQHSLKSESGFKDARVLPVLYNSERVYLMLHASTAEMVYTNDNAWFGQPAVMTKGNPLADHPSGKGFDAWLEGFGSAGIYGVVKIIPKINLHLYGGASYLISFSAGNELFTRQARIYAGLEDAFVGVVGGKRTPQGNTYRYNFTYGRKAFTLGDGFLLINTAMNGYNRAALQLNPRWAADRLILGSFAWNRMMLQGFSVRPDELDILNSRTTLNGVNAEMSNAHHWLFGATYLGVPGSGFKYYLPDGTAYSRTGLRVYNLRVYKTAGAEGGPFFKGEVGYQRNKNFDMNAWAYYGELGWTFHVKGAPSISYRYARFSGDDPASTSYNRWDALYTGGNGEQWVQGSVMYKIVQNSNEITHRIQAVYSPGSKFQLVGQFWLFYAAQLNNLGGNPALGVLQSRFYGTEYNLTLKYFHSRRWYFHLNAAYALPGSAIKDALPESRHWFAATAFARYSF